MTIVCPDCGTDHDTTACDSTGADTACDCCSAIRRQRWDAEPCANCGHGKHWHSTSASHDCYGPMMELCMCRNYQALTKGANDA